MKLPKPVLDIIEAQAELRANDFVFPASRVGRRDGPGEHFGSYSAFGQGKADLDKAMAEIAPKPVVPHLRRPHSPHIALADVPRWHPA